MCERLVLYQTVLSDTLEIRSLRLVLAEKQTVYQTVLSDTPEIGSLKPRLDRGEARALSFSKECQSLWFYLPINNHHASIPAQGIATTNKLMPSGRRHVQKNLLKGADFSVCTRHYFNPIHIVQINRTNTPKHAPLHKSTKKFELKAK